MRKYWHSWSCGIVGGHAIDAKLGSILWKRWRNTESGLVLMEKSSLMVMSNFVGGRCGWVGVNTTDGVTGCSLDV